MRMAHKVKLLRAGVAPVQKLIFLRQPPGNPLQYQRHKDTKHQSRRHAFVHLVSSWYDPGQTAASPPFRDDNS
jgi:hypothetical protein